eukprot:GHVS01026244.1.p1 GENE.GHVS01026244.1~~GHVS01026244.1.p1  ORF type:complete len:366 (+),score=86.57 GHVS01026244.1:43-1140(+)
MPDLLSSSSTMFPLHHCMGSPYFEKPPPCERTAANPTTTSFLSAFSPSSPLSFRVPNRTLCWLAAMFLLSVFLISGVLGGSLSLEQASRYGPLETEEEAYQLLITSTEESQVEQHDLQLAIGRSWWKLAQTLILKSHKQDRDFSTFIRSAVADVRYNTDELIRLLNKKHDEIAVMSPAFQWAQSPEQIFLNIKFAYRWSSPGALSVENEKIETKPCCFYFSGVGTHSHVKKEYRLELDLFDDLEPSETKWSFASVGKVFVTLQKKTPLVWKQLTRSPAKFPNMAVWWDMKEKFQDTNSNFLSESKNTSAESIGGQEEQGEDKKDKNLGKTSDDQTAAGGEEKEETKKKQTAASSSEKRTSENEEL